MTRTHSLHTTHRLAYFAFVAFFVLALSGAIVSAAHADQDPANKTVGGGGGGNGGMERMKKALAHANPNADLQSKLDELTKKLDELEARKNELVKKLNERRASSTPGTPSGNGTPGPNSNQGNWRDRICTGAGIGNMPAEIKERICNREHRDDHRHGPGGGHGTSTPRDDMERMKEIKDIKVLRPNGGTVTKRGIDGSLLIAWHAPKGMTKFDIDHKKGSTTTSIADDTEGKLHRCFPELGSNNASSSTQCEKDMKNKRVFGYVWKNAPEGSGNKIVISGMMGTTTLSDESDREFKIVKKTAKAANSQDDDDDDGSVLGASTTAEDRFMSQTDRLIDIVAELSVELWR